MNADRVTRRLLELRQRYGWRVDVGRIARARYHEVTMRHAVVEYGPSASNDRYTWMQQHYRELREYAQRLARTAEIVLAALRILFDMLAKIITAEAASLYALADMPKPPPPLRDPDLALLHTAPRPGPAVGIAAAA